jgi:hypothetical protein
LTDFADAVFLATVVDLGFADLATGFVDLATFTTLVDFAEDFGEGLVF